MVKDLKRHSWLYVLTTFWANTVQEDCTGQAGVYSQDSVTFGHVISVWSPIASPRLCTNHILHPSHSLMTYKYY